jgi:hypothetical protein
MELAINNTITFLRGFEPEGRLDLTATGQAILRNPAASTEVKEYLDELTLKANEAAASLFCGSILAGQSSETDDYGDVGVWLGELGIEPGSSKSKSEVILEALSLTRWVEEVP